MKRLRLFLFRVWRWYRHRVLYVILDATDNSVTLSRVLFELMDVMTLEEAKVFVFHLCNHCTDDASHSGALYAFMINPNFGMSTQLADIQYNAKHRTIGFETLCPTVNRIFFDYGIPATATKVKLTVKPVRLTKPIAFPPPVTVPSGSPEGSHTSHPIYYIIMPPRKP